MDEMLARAPRRLLKRLSAVRQRAHADPKGCVLRLFARSQVAQARDVDDITVSHLSLDGNRAARRC